MSLHVERTCTPSKSESSGDRLLSSSACRLRLDAERLALLYKRSQILEQIYLADIELFLAFPDSLLVGKVQNTAWGVLHLPDRRPAVACSG
jgi:hypothetical protein